jgi:hypothetical protein
MGYFIGVIIVIILMLKLFGTLENKQVRKNNKKKIRGVKYVSKNN